MWKPEGRRVEVLPKNIWCGVNHFCVFDPSPLVSTCFNDIFNYHIPWRIQSYGRLMLTWRGYIDGECNHIYHTYGSYGYVVVIPRGMLLLMIRRYPKWPLRSLGFPLPPRWANKNNIRRNKSNVGKKGGKQFSDENCQVDGFFNDASIVLYGLSCQMQHRRNHQGKCCHIKQWCVVRAFWFWKAVQRGLGHTDSSLCTGLCVLHNNIRSWCH